MRIPFRLGPLALSLALALALACERATPAPSATSPRPATGSDEAPSTDVARIPRRGETAAGLEYLELVTGRADPEAALPLVAAIHGMGDRPESFAGLVHDLPVPARVVVPRAPLPYHGGHSWFAYSPGTTDGRAVAEGIARAAARLSEALTEIARTRPTRGKPIVTGFSQGGMLSFALALHHRTGIAAALPVGGMLPAPLWPKGRASPGDPPIVAAHGAADDIVPAAAARATVARLRELGHAVELHEHPGVGHTITEAMRRELLWRLAELVQRAR